MEAVDALGVLKHTKDQRNDALDSVAIYKTKVDELKTEVAELTEKLRQANEQLGGTEDGTIKPADPSQ